MAEYVSGAYKTSRSLSQIVRGIPLSPYFEDPTKYCSKADIGQINLYIWIALSQLYEGQTNP